MLSSCRSEAGWALTLVAIALLAVALGALAAGEAVLQGSRAAWVRAEREQALLLAEAGAAEGLARAAAGLAALSAPRRICRTSLDPECTASAADYLGCYTYRKAAAVLTGLRDCPVPDGVHVGVSVYAVYGVGLTARGHPAQVRMVWWHSGVNIGRLTVLEVVR